jgi:hypothetical protein
MYADLYIQCAKLGIEVIGESQLVGFKSQFPSVSMMNYKTARPNARYWVLKMLLDHFAVGDKMAQTDALSADIAVQAFETSRGRMLLVINKRNRERDISIPLDDAEPTVTYVSPSTGDNEPSRKPLAGASLALEPFEVAIVSYR